MKLKIRVVLLAFVTAVIPLSLSAEGGLTQAVASRDAARTYANLPLRFEPAAEQGHFLARSSGYAVLVGPAESAIAVTAKSGSTQTLRFRFDGSNAAARIEAIEPLPGITNYYIGQDSSKWRLGVRNFAKLRTKDAYPGVDVVYYGDNRRLEFDFVVAPMADPSAIALALSGMDKLYINAEGELVAEVSGHPVKFAKPRAYQKVEGNAQAVSVVYALAGPGKARLQIGEYDKNLELVIDPTLSYSTYLGGTQGDTANGIAVDTAGNAYITGQTCSSDFPDSPNPSGYLFAPNCDAFVTKINPAGTAIIYTTLIGGTYPATATASGNAIALDSANAAYIVGTTNFQGDTSNGYVGQLPKAVNHYLQGDSKAFIAILNSDGTLLRTAYLGGTGIEVGNGVAVDSQKNVIAVGRTCSVDFPVYSGFEEKIEACVGFITKLDNALDICPQAPGSRYIDPGIPPTGGTCYFSEYWGGQPPNVTGFPGVWLPNYRYLYGDVINVLAFDGSKQVKVAQKCIRSGKSGATEPIWTTTLGDTNTDPTGGTLQWQNTGAPGTLVNASTTVTAAAVDPLDDVFVAGGTTSLFIGCPLCGQWSWLLGTGPWVLKVSKDGSQIYSTVLESGTSVTSDTANAIAVDPGGHAYVAGTSTGNLYTTSGAYQGKNAGGQDAFVVRVNQDGTAFDYATYLGGGLDDEGQGVAVDINGAVYVTGITRSTNFPTVSAMGNPISTPPNTPMNALSGQQDAFVAKLIPGGSALAFSTYLGGTDSDSGLAIAVHQNAAADNDMYVAGVTSSTDFPIYAGTSSPVQSVYHSNQDAFVAVILGASFPSLTVTPSLGFDPQTVNTSSTAQNVTVRNVGTTPVTIYSITISGEFSAAHNCPATMAVAGSCTISVTFTPTDTGTLKGTIIIIDNSSASTHTVQLAGTGTALAPGGGGGATSTTDFSLTPSTTTLAVTKGTPASFTVSLTPSGGFTGSVLLACTPTTICSISTTGSGTSGGTTGPTATVTVSGTTPATATVTVNIAAGNTITIGGLMKPGRLLATLLPFGAIGLVFAGRRRRWLLLLGLAACLALGMVACGGGGGGGSSSSSQQVTLTATPQTGTGSAKTITVALNVS